MLLDGQEKDFTWMDKRLGKRSFRNSFNGEDLPSYVLQKNDKLLFFSGVPKVFLSS